MPEEYFFFTTTTIPNLEGEEVEVYVEGWWIPPTEPRIKNGIPTESAYQGGWVLGDLIVAGHDMTLEQACEILGYWGVGAQSFAILPHSPKTLEDRLIEELINERDQFM